jgi:hypothetical protein
MANMKFANNANTTLASSLTAIATSMSVTSASKFPVLNPLAPVPEYFYCTLTDVATQTVIEIVKVTVTTGTTWTITRGQDGTTGTAFAAGDVVSLRLVKASLDLFPKLDEVNTFTSAQTANSWIPTSSSIPTNGMYLPAANSVGFATNSTRAVYIDSSQNVGIGISGPLEILSIYKDAAGPIGIRVENPHTVANGGVKLELSRGGAQRPAYIRYQTLTTDEWFVGELANGGVANTVYSISTTANLSGSKLAVFPSGGVSIGNTTDPGATNLSVTGTGKFGTTVGVGAATPSTSGAGITFPATQSASTNANTLDDYEEGTWTPKDNAGTSLFNYQTPTYTKTGRVVVLTFDFLWSADTDYHLSNLPFAGATSVEPGGSCIASTNSDSVASCKVGLNVTTASMLNQKQSAVTTANKRFSSTVTYITN